ncbi:glycine-rich domain-containing protein 1-like [Selaginella moellendorffii]|uniref:glycine-rich domain-containing protein 1-like n=1 Tax=Selaginella moellendorffii TaxID=88036 RepID=UPI000D1C4387|nr:glycine-rich domain-containing protein 1-like [Selaginella moellendorffii]|eukprot:XP_024521551.1 glycine-rich domain-containing protein 1-like [Selaginella moellendorffii]
MPSFEAHLTSTKCEVLESLQVVTAIFDSLSPDLQVGCVLCIHPPWATWMHIPVGRTIIFFSEVLSQFLPENLRRPNLVLDSRTTTRASLSENQLNEWHKAENQLNEWSKAAEVAVSLDVIPVLLPSAASKFFHCHRLNPVQYAEDCKRLFGKIVAGPSLARHESDLQQSANTWASNFRDEPYTLDIYGGDVTRRYTERATNISYDLAEAALRQKSFYYQASGDLFLKANSTLSMQVSDPHYLDESFLLAAAARYKAFLHLIRTSGTSTFFVPTYDIDLIWHTHQLHTVSYHNDLTQVLGSIFEHDDTDSNRGSGGKLDNGFTKTRSMWEDTYGLPYEKAGCMYRGEPPVSIPGTPAYDPTKLARLASKNDDHLAERKTIQVHLSVRGTRGLPDDKTISYVVSSLNHQKFLKLESQRVKAASQQNVVSVMTAELSTEGLVLAVRRRRVLISRTVGRLVIPWINVIRSETQSLGGWFPFQEDRQVSVLVYISVTSPVTAPYLFRSVRVRDTGDDSATHDSNRESIYKRGGFWLRSIPDTDKVVHAHKGGWTYKGSYNTGSVNGEILGSAWQLEKPSLESRRWSLQNGKAILTVDRNVKDKHWNMRPQLHVEMKSHNCPIMLFSGRHLDFAVPGASDRQEAWFVTMVRFTRDAPQGKATALFNWRSGGMQIDPNEDVLLVLLLSATISMSVSDMLGKAIPSWTMRSKRVVAERAGERAEATVVMVLVVQASAGMMEVVRIVAMWWSRRGGGSYCGDVVEQEVEEEVVEEVVEAVVAAGAVAVVVGVESHCTKR